MDNPELIIKGGTVVTPEGVALQDVAICNGKIVRLDPDLSGAAKIIDAKGLMVMPGGIDPHCHIEQMSGMGLMNADTFETATRSAAMGGTTTVISFAAQAKGEQLSKTVAAYSALAKRGAIVDYAFHMTVTDLTVANIDVDLVELINAGHRSIKVFTTYNIKLDDAAILHVMKQAKSNGALVCVHAENDAMIASAKSILIAKGKTAPKYHALSHPRMAEVEAISRMCHFAEYLDQPVMIFHVSTAEGLNVIRAARARGVPVTAETCPHYLLMTEDILDQPGIAGAKWMCSPPQRLATDQTALWGGLTDGTLDLVSSDHAPYRFDATGKLQLGPNPPFQDIANGLPGLETRLPLIFDRLVSKNNDPVQFARLTATQPADIYNLPGKGRIAVGFDADVTLWDPSKSVTYDADDLHDNVGYNPWEGFTVKGWPVRVLLRGQTIMQDGTVTGQPGQGQWLARAGLA